MFSNNAEPDPTKERENIMAAKTDAAGRRVKTKGEPPLAAYADKDITPVMSVYAAWLEEQTGYKVDPLSVQLSGVLRSTFQKSDVNQKRIADRAAEIERENEERETRRKEREERKAAREAAAAEKAAAPKATKAAPAKASTKAAPAAKAAPTKSAPAPKRTAATKATAAKPTASRRRPAAKPAAGGAESDF